ncbi:hypothetical protein [Brevundimonas sp. UBA7664]|uniref:hypothetical protein n=1 Tax=Brevundimonas sp. UBA7664 TaxID=1946141 RepID=UPI0025C462B9|nr:hypothetical protein [Brevundimonas sp. UBA7664]
MAEGPDRPPHQVIADHVASFAARTDEEVLQALAALAPLPDEDSAEWDDEQTWDRANLYTALADVAAIRRLRAAIPLLLERASFGDPGEMMRGLRHSLEAIVNPDWGALTTACMDLAASDRPGTRLWALTQLATLADERARPIFEAASESPLQEIREAGELGVFRLDRAGNTED